MQEQVIYAGETPLAWTGRVVRTGPWELTVEPGGFTTTGQAVVLPRERYAADELARLVAGGWAELCDAGRCVRRWLPDAQGRLERAETVVLAWRSTLPLPLPPGECSEVWLVVDAASTGRVVRWAGEWPAGWRPVHWLARLAADGTARALVVRPGFPPGTGAADWRLVVGESGERPLTLTLSPAAAGERGSGVAGAAAAGAGGLR